MPNNNKKIAKVEVRIPPELKEGFSEKCESQGKTVSETVREFIHSHTYSEHIDGEKGTSSPNRIYIISSVIVAILAVMMLFLVSSNQQALPDPKIIKIFNKYDRDNNGLLTLTDFENYKKYRMRRIAKGKSNVKSGLKSGKPPALISAKQFEQKYNSVALLARYDVNVDGVVDLAEFLTSKPALNYISWPAFHILDSNGDELISKDELLTYANGWFEGYPKDKKRALSYSNAKMWKHDRDKDGVIALREYRPLVDD